MMPVALGLLWLEPWVLSRLLVEKRPSLPLQVDLARLADVTPRPRPSEVGAPVG
jgi:hypothetical protein